MNEKILKKAADQLRDWAINSSSGSERLRTTIEEDYRATYRIVDLNTMNLKLKVDVPPPKSYFEVNDAYKVCYRLIGNMTQRWQELGLEHFPTEEESILIAKKVDPYFEWLFQQKDELSAFKSTYDFHKEVWEE